MTAGSVTFHETSITDNTAMYYMHVRVVTFCLSRISSITTAIGDELFVFSRLEQRDAIK